MRDSSFTCERNFFIFNDVIAAELRTFVLKSKGFFEHRALDASPTGAIRPVRIKYGTDVFADTKANHRLVDVLNGFENSSLAVYHPNPYLHASLLDYNDGSNYEIWITSKDAVLIVPRTRASSESIQRLCNHICDVFQEGEVEEALPS